MQIWEEFLLSLDNDLGKETVDRWLRSLKVDHFDALNIYLQAGDSFQTLWFEEHVRKRARKGLLSKNGKPIHVHIETTSPLPSKAKRKKTVEKEPPFELTLDTFDRSLRSESFTPTEGSALAHQALTRLGGGVDLGTFNPIYLCGGEGTGKTHLLQAAAQTFEERGLKVLYARAETFTDHVIKAIRAGQMGLFRKTYRNIDILLIDDVQAIARKAATQEELFHTFNTLHTEGRQIILASRDRPQELQAVEPRLVSRFEWGLVLPLSPATEKELNQILLAKAKAFGITLAADVIPFLVKSFSKNAKRAIRALDALVLRSHLNNRGGAITLASAERTLRDLIAEEQKDATTPTKIVAAVARFYGIQSDDILGKSQKKECALPRKVAMHLCRQQLSFPFAEIGRLFSRDHSTVMTSVKQVKSDVELGHVSNAIAKDL